MRGGSKLSSGKQSRLSGVSIVKCGLSVKCSHLERLFPSGRPKIEYARRAFCLTSYMTIT
ncbi:Hypothetical protein PP7435_CHR1-2973 [Komagataella phaffii CBS 7435]|uniref:Uncharacterized protein n=1 Tax=Komagataella phaffii (strain ATCC 76273 / CBS 7435 / CECT 11047 / NRRL Y-11430 / Wegner 21-1) TaxID=981350 RepID=A0A1G4KPI3_KOMPC|nr:Hypothetical protein BQ9382_C1-6728 [Komagataella phaffii CBS 7435]SCV11917.1 Hypothetical protein PP7435_CHR1-2973 [Komagataella phaffii CBS 7435]